MNLCVPANAKIDFHQFETLETLTMYNAHLSPLKPRTLPALPQLRRLSLELDETHYVVENPMIDLYLEPSLEELYLVTPQVWTRSTHLCTGMSTSIWKLVMVGAFSFSSTRQFTNFLHRLSSDNISSMSLKGLILDCSSKDWPLMLNLRSFECIGMDPTCFLHMHCAGLRKILLEYHGVIAMKVISKVLRTATQLISFSVVSHSRPVTSYTPYTSKSVSALASSRNLKHFQSIGPYVFTRHHWKMLCRTTFRFLKLVHVFHPRVCPSRRRTDKVCPLFPFHFLTFSNKVSSTLPAARSKNYKGGICGRATKRETSRSCRILYLDRQSFILTFTKVKHHCLMGY
jgi:hypothetical protein